MKIQMSLLFWNLRGLLAKGLSIVGLSGLFYAILCHSLTERIVIKSKPVDRYKRYFNLLAFSFLVIVFLTACQSEKTKVYSLSELEQNKKNILGLKANTQPDLKKLCDDLFEIEGREKLEKRLSKADIDLFEVSYIFYTLGVDYLRHNDFEKGMQYLHIAADDYLNPLAMIRLARIYVETKEVVSSKFPQGAVKDFEQDFQKVYHYLHWALNTAILTMEYFKDRYAIDIVNEIATPLIDGFEGQNPKFSPPSDFDKDAAAKDMEKQLPTIRAEFEKLYGIEGH